MALLLMHRAALFYKQLESYAVALFGSAMGGFLLPAARYVLIFLGVVFPRGTRKNHTQRT
jgi:hypothetical protein